jgi:hypothetical protein
MQKKTKNLALKLFKIQIKIGPELLSSQVCFPKNLYTQGYSQPVFESVRINPRAGFLLGQKGDLRHKQQDISARIQNIRLV